MRPITIAGTLVLGLALLAACADRTNPTAAFDRPLFAGVPADGNANKEVIPIDVQLPGFVTCEGGATLDLHVGGWLQVRIFGQPGNRNVELDVAHLVFTFTNSVGTKFVWREIGIDRFYVDDGDVLHAIIGRVGVPGIIGRIVVNLTTGEVQFVAGNQVGNRFDLACAALT